MYCYLRSVGVLIIGACPGGTTSNLFSLWGNGTTS